MKFRLIDSQAQSLAQELIWQEIRFNVKYDDDRIIVTINKSDFPLLSKTWKTLLQRQQNV